MRIDCLIERLPDSVKMDVADFTPVRLKTGETALRVLMDRMLTDEEKTKLRKWKTIVGVDCVAQYRYAPEIQKSYFYVKGEV